MRDSASPTCGAMALWVPLPTTRLQLDLGTQAQVTRILGQRPLRLGGDQVAAEAAQAADEGSDPCPLQQQADADQRVGRPRLVGGYPVVQGLGLRGGMRIDEKLERA